MSTTADHTQLVYDTRIALGKIPDLTIWQNSRVHFHNGKPIAKPGLGTGSSDLIAILSPSGRILALEAKTGDATTTKEQKQFLNLIRKRGGFAAVFHSVEEAEQAVNRARRGLFE